MLVFLLLTVFALAGAQDDAAAVAPPSELAPEAPPSDPSASAPAAPSEPAPAAPIAASNSATAAPSASAGHSVLRGSDIYTVLAQFGTIECDGNTMKIEIPRDQLRSPIDTYSLLDRSCRPNATETHVTFEYGSNECGTVFQGNETHWIRSNTVLNVDPQFPPMPGSMLLHNHQKASFRCVHPRAMETTPAVFEPALTDRQYEISGETVADINFNLYTDSELSQGIDLTRKLKLNTTLYGVISRVAIGDTGTYIVPSQCHAYAESSPSEIMPMLKAHPDACWTLKQFLHLNHNDDRYVFSFPVFGFVSRGDVIKMECIVLTCKKVNETNEACLKMPTESCQIDTSDPTLKTSPIVRRELQPLHNETDEEMPKLPVKTVAKFLVERAGLDYDDPIKHHSKDSTTASTSTTEIPKTTSTAALETSSASFASTEGSTVLHISTSRVIAVEQSTSTTTTTTSPNDASVVHPLRKRALLAKRLHRRWFSYN